MFVVVLQCILAVPYGLHDTMGVLQVVSSAVLCIPSVQADSRVHLLTPGDAWSACLHCLDSV